MVEDSRKVCQRETIKGKLIRHKEGGWKRYGRKSEGSVPRSDAGKKAMAREKKRNISRGKPLLPGYHKKKTERLKRFPTEKEAKEKKRTGGHSRDGVAKTRRSGA